MTVCLAIAVAYTGPHGAAAAAGVDPLPSWRDGAAKNAILAFLAQTTTEGAPAFVPLDERVVVFDNDGTLWPENPAPFQLLFAIDSLRELTVQRPELRSDPAVEAARSSDLAALLADDRRGLARVLELTHTGLTTDEFAARARGWIASAEHPRFHRSFDRCVYQPMLEVLRLFRSHGFRTVIVSGGGADFMRAWSERVYGIPPGDVIGSNAATRYELRSGVPTLIKTLDRLYLDDREGKPPAIHQFLGRRPIACFGNSDGDQQMLEYTTIGNPCVSLGVIIHHDDADREYAYDSSPKSTGRLAKALDEAPQRGWHVVSMLRDWREILAP